MRSPANQLREVIIEEFLHQTIDEDQEHIFFVFRNLISILIKQVKERMTEDELIDLLRDVEESLCPSQNQDNTEILRRSYTRCKE